MHNILTVNLADLKISLSERAYQEYDSSHDYVLLLNSLQDDFLSLDNALFMFSNINEILFFCLI
jgi:hypothetical protein